MHADDDSTAQDTTPPPLDVVREALADAVRVLLVERGDDESPELAADLLDVLEGAERPFSAEMAALRRAAHRLRPLDADGRSLRQERVEARRHQAFRDGAPWPTEADDDDLDAEPLGAALADLLANVPADMVAWCDRKREERTPLLMRAAFDAFADTAATADEIAWSNLLEAVALIGRRRSEGRETDDDREAVREAEKRLRPLLSTTRENERWHSRTPRDPLKAVAPADPWRADNRPEALRELLTLAQGAVTRLPKLIAWRVRDGASDGDSFATEVHRMATKLLLHADALGMIVLAGGHRGQARIEAPDLAARIREKLSAKGLDARGVVRLVLTAGGWPAEKVKKALETAPEFGAEA